MHLDFYYGSRAAYSAYFGLGYVIENTPTTSTITNALQYWWANGLLQLGISIYKLDIVITGQAAIYGPTALVAARHTSIGDTVLPMMYFAKTRNEGMRYILKQELTVMPCLDIAGHRLPNLFVDRSGVDTEAELNAVRQLTRHASERENIMVYPEGTRFTPQKASRLKRTKPELSDQFSPLA